MNIVRLILCLLILSGRVYAQYYSGDSIIVTLEIVQKGNPSFCSDLYKNCDGNNYFSRAAVINNTHSTVFFYMFNCSWEESWISDNKDVFFYYMGCDHNFPIKVTLKPKKSLVFYGTIRTTLKEIDNKQFKMGFFMMNLNEISNLSKFDYTKNKAHWSNTIDLRNWSCPFKIDGLGECHDEEIK